jgi:hypothetical protein
MPVKCYLFKMNPVIFLDSTMRRAYRLALVLTLILTAAVLFPRSASCSDTPPTTMAENPSLNSPTLERPFPSIGNATIEILVSLLESDQGVLHVTERFKGFEGPEVRLINHSNPREIELRDFRFTNPDGLLLESRQEQETLVVLTGRLEAFDVSFVVQPGGIGRHGHQGHVGQDFASFDGKVFLYPETYERVTDVSLQFKLPPGWKSLVPFEQWNGSYRIPRLGGIHPLNHLSETPMAFGPFESTKRIMGTTSVVVSSYESWPADHKNRVARNSFDIWRYFQQTLGYDPGGSFFITWTPRGEDGERIFGGSYSLGTCYEMPALRLRNWELLSHRIGHAMNKYPPYAMTTVSVENSWFLEGFASWVEGKAPVRAGVLPEWAYFERLYRDYLDMLENHPEYNLPLIDERKANDNTAEFVHYWKTPLVMEMLDCWLRNQGRPGIEKFVRTMYARHRNFSSPLSFRKELEQFYGLDLEPFWRILIRRQGHVVPCWRNMKGTSQPFSNKGDRVREYAFLVARTAGEETVVGVLDFLDREVRRRNELLAKGLHPYPNLARSAETLESGARLQLALLEQELMPVPALKKKTSAARMEPTAGDFSKTIGILLRAENEYKRVSGAGPMSDMVLSKATNMPPNGIMGRLGFLPDEEVAVYCLWKSPGRTVRYELVSPSGRMVDSRTLTIKSDWRSSWGVFTQRDRESGVWTVRVVDESGNVIAAKPFWQENF